MYSVADRASFEKIPTIIENARKQNQNASLILVANKTDQAGVVSEQEGKIMALNYGLHFIKVSCIENINVTEAYLLMTRSILYSQKETWEHMAKKTEKHIKMKKHKCCMM
jgi:GTPase SAR1 family protein